MTDAGENSTRCTIHDAIASDPGIHFNALVRDCSLAPGQVQYHVRRLIRDGSVTRHERFGRTHYFAPATAYEEWERDAMALLRRETTGAIVTALYARERARPGDLVEALEIPRSTLEHHLDHLLECDLIERHHPRGNRVVLSLSRPAETAALLETVDPHPGSRLVDRFERLVDSLLDS